MPVKEYDLASIGIISIHKRRGAKTLRLSIAADGKIRVTIPSWARYSDGVQYAESKAAWIRLHLPQPTAILMSGQHIGKAHRLLFISGKGAVRSRLSGADIVITHPPGTDLAASTIQEVAHKACIRALRLEAQKLLPVRLRTLANTYGFSYTSVSVKQLKGRWGSCDSKQRVVLNLFLMQLPWQLIDYVLVHELVHTEHLNHGPEFWQRFLQHEPRAKYLRTQIRTHKPILEAVPSSTAMA